MTDLTDMAAEEAVWREHLRTPERPLFSPEQVLMHLRASVADQIARYTRECNSAWLSELGDLYDGYAHAYCWVATAIDIASGVAQAWHTLAELKRAFVKWLQAAPAGKDAASRCDVMRRQGMDNATRWMLARLEELQSA